MKSATKETTGFRPNRVDHEVIQELRALCPEQNFADFVRAGLRIYLTIKQANPAIDPLGWARQAVAGQSTFQSISVAQGRAGAPTNKSRALDSRGSFARQGEKLKRH